MTEIDYLITALLVLTMGGWLEWRINKVLKITDKVILRLERIEDRLYPMSAEARTNINEKD